MAEVVSDTTHLRSSLLEQDEFGNWVINQKFNAEMLAEAMCKLEGFTYAPSDEFYWQHGHSTETTSSTSPRKR